MGEAYIKVVIDTSDVDRSGGTRGGVGGGGDPLGVKTAVAGGFAARLEPLGHPGTHTYSNDTSTRSYSSAPDIKVEFTPSDEAALKQAQRAAAGLPHDLKLDLTKDIGEQIGAYNKEYLEKVVEAARMTKTVTVTQRDMPSRDAQPSSQTRQARASSGAAPQHLAEGIAESLEKDIKPKAGISATAKSSVQLWAAYQVAKLAYKGIDWITDPQSGYLNFRQNEQAYLNKDANAYSWINSAAEVITKATSWVPDYFDSLSTTYNSVKALGALGSQENLIPSILTKDAPIVGMGGQGFGGSYYQSLQNSLFKLQRQGDAEDRLRKMMLERNFWANQGKLKDK